MKVLWLVFWAIWVLAALLVVAYGWVILFGAPYIPTLKKQQTDAIKLMGLRKGQQFIDLGCGDGGLLILAAEQGWQAVGYELNPFLAATAWLRTRKYGRLVKVKLGSFWRADISKADGIFVFLIGHYMKKLDRFIDHQPHKQLRLVSNAFAIPGRKPHQKTGPLLLYVYPERR